MMNRRQFVYGMTCAAGTLTFARASSAFAAAAPARYDLIIKGGRVIDPSLRISAIRDVAIAGGRIAAVEANITTRRGRNHRCARQARRSGPARRPYPCRPLQRGSRLSASRTA